MSCHWGHAHATLWGQVLSGVGLSYLGTSSSWDFSGVELNTKRTSSDTAAAVAPVQSENHTNYAHISLFSIFTITFNSIQHH